MLRPTGTSICVSFTWKPLRSLSFQMPAMSQSAAIRMAAVQPTQALQAGADWVSGD